MQLLFGASFETSQTDSNAVINNMEIVQQQLNRYLKEPVDINQDPLSWWKSNETMYWTLAPHARQVLGIMGTSVPSERLFSAAGNLLSAKRSCLSSKNVDMMLFLHRNLK